MAYMSTEHAKIIRDNLKKEFPEFKFSIKKRHSSSIVVSILSSPLDFSKDIEKSGYDYVQLNHHYLENYEHTDVLKKIYDIINTGNHDNSDAMTDYFDVGFYVHMNIGEFEKPYKQIK
jgi:hypothetical protein